MARTPSTAELNRLYADGLQRLRARGINVPAGPTMSASPPQPKKPAGGWEVPRTRVEIDALVASLQAVASGILTPEDRRRAAPGRRAPVAARAALPSVKRPRTTEDVNAASRTVWAQYRAGRGAA